MSFGEPIGYVWEGGVYCKDCMDKGGGPVTSESEEVGAIFEEIETDYPEHCGDCHVFLGGQLTKEGWKWMQEQILDFHFRDRELLEEYMHHYDHYDWFIIPSFQGYWDPLGNLKEE